MKVYRLEGSSLDYSKITGLPLGIYQTGVAHHLIEEGKQSPSPSFDARLAPLWNRLRDNGLHYSFVFGFDSLESLKRWFYDEEALKDNTDLYRLTVYDVPDSCVHIGTAQVIFKACSANLQEILDNSVLYS